MQSEIVVSPHVLDTYRISARVLPFDDEGRLLLMRRVQQDAEYVVSLGGGTAEGEAVAEAAVRECFEEAGATVDLRGLVLVVLDPPPRPSAQYFYAATLRSLDPAQRNGNEFSRKGRGTYEPICVSSGSPELELVQPPALRELLRHDWSLVSLQHQDACRQSSSSGDMRRDK